MRPSSHSRRGWLALGASLVLLGVLLTVRFRGSAVALPPETALGALRAEHARLSPFSAAALNALRRERDLLRATPTSGEILPASWSEHAGEERTTYRYGGDSPLAWAELVRAVTLIERRSGGRIVSLDIRSRGTREQREVAAVKMVTGAPATARPQADAPSPGAVGPSRPRKVGRGSSRRRPSACAVRPASRLRLPARPSLLPSPTLRGRPALRSSHIVSNPAP